MGKTNVRAILACGGCAVRSFYLVRHGKVDFPGGVRRCIGKTEYPLSQEGIEQARDLRRFFEDKPIERVFSSPIGRCRQTAEVLADGRFLLEEDPGLVELFMGEWEDVPLSELKKTLASEPAGGEGRRAGLERFARTIDGILARTSGDVVCVAHAGINCCYLSSLLGSPLETSRGLPQPYGGFSEIRIDDSGRASVAQLGRMPRTAPTPRACRTLLERYGTPLKVRHHSRAVSCEALQMASALNEAGCSLDLELVEAAALLHDIARTEKDHAAVGAEWLRREGYPQVASIIACHHDITLAPARDAGALPDEADVVYLADKLVRGEELVSLDERFAASRARCAAMEDAGAALAAHDRRYREAKEVESKVRAALSCKLRTAPDGAPGPQGAAEKGEDHDRAV